MSNNAIINFLFNSQGAVNQLNEFKNKFSNVVSSIENSAIGKFGAIGASLASIFSVKSLVDHAKQVDALHMKYRDLLSLGDVSHFSNLYRLLGGKDEEAMSSLERAQQLVQDLARGIAPKELAVLGITEAIDKETGKLKSGVQLLEELREVLRTYTPSQRTDFLKKLGLDSATMQKYMNLNGEKLDKYNKAAKEMGEISQETIDRIDAWNFSVARLRGSFEKLGETLLKLGAGKLVDALTEALEKFCELPEETQMGIMLIVGGLMMLKPALSITRNIYALAKAFGALAVSLAPYLFIAFIVAVIFNIGGLRDALDDCLKSFREWIDEFSKEHPFAASLLKQLADLADAILHPIKEMERAQALWNSLWADFEREHPISFEWVKQLGRMLEAVVNPVQALIDTYNAAAQVMGWSRIETAREKEKRAEGQQNLSSKLDEYVELNAEKMGVANEAVAQTVEEVKSENVKEDNRAFNLTVNADFSGANVENQSTVMSALTKAGDVVMQQLKTVAINYGG